MRQKQPLKQPFHSATTLHIYQYTSWQCFLISLCLECRDNLLQIRPLHRRRPLQLPHCLTKTLSQRPRYFFLSSFLSSPFNILSLAAPSAAHGEEIYSLISNSYFFTASSFLLRVS